VEKSLSFDTTFLIDIQKELKAGRKGRAHRFLERHSERSCSSAAVTVGEFAQGFASPGDPSLQGMLASVEILDIDRETGLLYAANVRRLPEAGQLIGSNDIWIGCSALRHDTPLVTRNPERLRRIEAFRSWNTDLHHGTKLELRSPCPRETGYQARAHSRRGRKIPAGYCAEPDDGGSPRASCHGSTFQCTRRW